MAQYVSRDVELCLLQDQRPVVTVEQQHCEYYTVLFGFDTQHYLQYNNALKAYHYALENANTANHHLLKNYDKTVQYGVQHHENTIDVYTVEYFTVKEKPRTEQFLDTGFLKRRVDAAYGYLHERENDMATYFGYHNFYTAFQQPFIRNILNKYTIQELHRIDDQYFDNMNTTIDLLTARVHRECELLNEELSYRVSEDTMQQLWTTIFDRSRRFYTEQAFQNIPENVDHVPLDWLIPQYVHVETLTEDVKEHANSFKDDFYTMMGL